jgi:hypothetical protein
MGSDSRGWTGRPPYSFRVCFPPVLKEMQNIFRDWRESGGGIVTRKLDAMTYVLIRWAELSVVKPGSIADSSD